MNRPSAETENLYMRDYTMTDNGIGRDYTNRTWLYHPSGAKVEIALPYGAKETLTVLNEYLEAGFTVGAPAGLDNADRLDVSMVVRGQVTNNGVTKDRIYMYADWGKPEYGSQQVVYMNTPEDAAAFENASGIKIAALPIVRGKAGPIKDSEAYETNARPCQFSLLRHKVNVTEEDPKGNWELLRYLSASSAPIPAQDGAGTKITPMPVPTTTSHQLPPNNVAQPTPEQLEAERLSTERGYPVDFSKNPPPNNRNDVQGWNVWLTRQEKVWKGKQVIIS